MFRVWAETAVLPVFLVCVCRFPGCGHLLEILPIRCEQDRSLVFCRGRSDARFPIRIRREDWHRRVVSCVRWQGVGVSLWPSDLWKLQRWVVLVCSDPFFLEVFRRKLKKNYGLQGNFWSISVGFSWRNCAKDFFSAQPTTPLVAFGDLFFLKTSKKWTLNAIVMFICHRLAHHLRHQVWTCCSFVTEIIYLCTHLYPSREHLDIFDRRHGTGFDKVVVDGNRVESYFWFVVFAVKALIFRCNLDFDQLNFRR